ncbi:MAG TPA: hypothetical protein VN039_15820, partial [Nitrospira sp.]|nr:hypothetical protein [Nitrospira sp.]
NLGWVPQEEFRGDASRWISAEAFVERGEHIMPILKANNERLQSEVAGLRGQLSQFQLAIQEGRESIEELRKFHTEDTERKVQLARKNLLAELKAAKKEGDTDREVDLQGELSELDSALREEKTTPVTPVQRQQPAIDPEFIAWQTTNPWFGVDKKRTALMTASAEELRADPKNNTLLGRRFYEAAAAEASRILDGSSKRSSKVEVGGPSGGSASGPVGRSYSDLPAEAKEVCERQSAKLVGENRAFKTKAEWQKHYVEQFFAGE